MPKNQIQGNAEGHSTPGLGRTCVGPAGCAQCDQEHKLGQPAGAPEVSEAPPSQRMWAGDPGPRREGRELRFYSRGAICKLSRRAARSDLHLQRSF